MAETAKRLRIHGRVQGVCYRAWAVETARLLRLGGWVRNRSDGTVEILVGGSDTGVRQMIERAQEGPPAALVARVDVEETDEEVAAGFGTRPTL